MKRRRRREQEEREEGCERNCAKKYGLTDVAISGNWSTPRAFVCTVNYLLVADLPDA